MLNALGVAACVLLLDNPNLFLDTGFQFSFAAILGVAVSSMEPKMKGKILSGLGSSLGIQLTTLPLVAWCYYEIPVYAMVVNFLILPCMGILLSVGIVGGFLALVWMKGASLVLFPCKFLLEGSIFLCSFFAKLPMSQWITGKPTIVRMLGYYILLAIILLWCKYGREIKWFRAGKVLGMGMLFVLLLVRGPQKFELDVLDVGQGDGIYLQTADGWHMFVDGGSSDVGKVGQYRILPFLKSKAKANIDFWFVSHTDLDHISGLQELLAAGYQIDHLVFSREVVRDETFYDLVELAETHHTQIVYLQEGEILHVGGATIQALFPFRKAGLTDKNAASLVFLYEEGDFSGLFTGDIGVEEEKKLVSKYLPQNLDFYKAAHHGSSGSNSSELLQKTVPNITVISCSRKNHYGHPGAEAVERIGKVGSKVFYTMESGQIKLIRQKEQLLVEKYMESGQ